MDFNRFLKWAAAFVVVVVGMLYLASALLVSEKISSLVDFRKNVPEPVTAVKDTQPTKLVGTLTVGDKPSFEISVDHVESGGDDSQPPKPQAYRVKLDSGAEMPIQMETVADEKNDPDDDHQTGAGRAALAVLPILVRVVFLAVFLLAPVAIFYVFLFRPLKDIPEVEPDAIKALDDPDFRRRKEAGEVIASAMWEADSCSKEDRLVLQKALENPSDIAVTVKSILENRERAAKEKAVEIASMAGLTMAVSSSSLGDGLGMFFWKSKLVYETFRIYGFRPDARTTVSIWAHVVFASLLAASVDELCELFDVSELVGGIGARAIQGTVGAAVVLKGGQLTRAYLTQGISSESRRWALSEFKNSAKDDLASVASSVGESLTKIGLRHLHHRMVMCEEDNEYEQETFKVEG